MTPAILDSLKTLPLRSTTPLQWAQAVLAQPIPLLIDHAFLEKKAANNALELMTQWPHEWFPGWLETMTSVARDEAAHLAQVVRLLICRGGRLDRCHKNEYASSLRRLVRKGQMLEIVDRLLVSALIEVRSCERFAVLAEAADDRELGAFYRALFFSEMGHYKVFLELASRVGPADQVEARWQHLLNEEATIIAAQAPGPRIHGGPMAVGSSTP